MNAKKNPSNLLPNGGVLPSNVNMTEELNMKGVNNANYYSTKNYSLKVGQVKEIFPSDDDKNVHKAGCEYTVLVSEKTENGTAIDQTYPSVTAMDKFGGLADFMEFSYRPSETNEAKKRGAQFSEGATVLILCLNGSKEDAVIIGGMRHPNRENVLKKEDGHAMRGAFNGIEFSIDKDGAFSFEFKGATNVNGEPLDDSVGVTSMKIEKDGTVDISVGDTESIRVDKTKGTIDVKSSKAQSFLTDDSYLIDAGKDITLKSGASLFIDITGAATFKSKVLSFDNTKMDIKTKLFKVESSAIAEFKTNLFKTNNLTQLGGGSIPMVLSTLTTFGLTAPLPLPVTSVLVSGFATKVFGA